MLDPYSLVKSNKTKLFHLGFENSKGNIKEKIKLFIFQLDYIINIFIPFFSTKKTGSGIGLSLCKQIMLLHKGNVQVQSIEGEGSAFLLHF